ncbi:MAG TPA: hypothetical protein VF265_10230, partial [Nevskiaceae bacterium]
GALFGSDVQASGHPEVWYEIVVDDGELPPCDYDDLEHRFGTVTEAMRQVYIDAFASSVLVANDA